MGNFIDSDHPTSDQYSTSIETIHPHFSDSPQDSYLNGIRIIGRSVLLGHNYNIDEIFSYLVLPWSLEPSRDINHLKVMDYIHSNVVDIKSYLTDGVLTNLTTSKLLSLDTIKLFKDQYTNNSQEVQNTNEFSNSFVRRSPHSGYFPVRNNEISESTTFTNTTTKWFSRNNCENNHNNNSLNNSRIEIPQLPRKYNKTLLKDWNITALNYNDVWISNLSNRKGTNENSSTKSHYNMSTKLSNDGSFSDRFYRINSDMITINNISNNNEQPALHLLFDPSMYQYQQSIQKSESTAEIQMLERTTPNEVETDRIPNEFEVIVRRSFYHIAPDPLLHKTRLVEDHFNHGFKSLPCNKTTGTVPLVLGRSDQPSIGQCGWGWLEEIVGHSASELSGRYLGLYADEEQKLKFKRFHNNRDHPSSSISENSGTDEALSKEPGIVYDSVETVEDLLHGLWKLTPGTLGYIDSVVACAVARFKVTISALSSRTPEMETPLTEVLLPNPQKISVPFQWELMQTEGGSSTILGQFLLQETLQNNQKVVPSSQGTLNVANQPTIRQHRYMLTGNQVDRALSKWFEYIKVNSPSPILIGAISPVTRSYRTLRCLSLFSKMEQIDKMKCDTKLLYQMPTLRASLLEESLTDALHYSFLHRKDDALRSFVRGISISLQSISTPNIQTFINTLHQALPSSRNLIHNFFDLLEAEFFHPSLFPHWILNSTNWSGIVDILMELVDLSTNTLKDDLLYSHILAEFMERRNSELHPIYSVLQVPDEGYDFGCLILLLRTIYFMSLFSSLLIKFFLYDSKYMKNHSNLIITMKQITEKSNQLLIIWDSITRRTTNAPYENDRTQRLNSYSVELWDFAEVLASKLPIWYILRSKIHIHAALYKIGWLMPSSAKTRDNASNSLRSLLQLVDAAIDNPIIRKSLKKFTDLVIISKSITDTLCYIGQQVHVIEIEVNLDFIKRLISPKDARLELRRDLSEVHKGPQLVSNQRSLEKNHKKRGMISSLMTSLFRPDMQTFCAPRVEFMNYVEVAESAYEDEQDPIHSDLSSIPMSEADIHKIELMEYCSQRYNGYVQTRIDENDDNLISSIETIPEGHDVEAVIDWLKHFCWTFSFPSLKWHNKSKWIPPNIVQSTVLQIEPGWTNQQVVDIINDEILHSASSRAITSISLKNSISRFLFDHLIDENHDDCIIYPSYNIDEQSCESVN